MSFSERTVWQKFCGTWTGWAARHAKLVVVGVVLLTIVSGFYTANNVSVNTDTEDMLSPELPFRQNAKALDKAFPQFSDNIVVVVDAPTADQTHDAANALVQKLRENTELFGEVFDPSANPFFQKNGLLYLEIEEVELLTERLARAQPFLGRLNASPTLPELFRLLEQTLEASAGTEAVVPVNTVASIFHQISDVIEAQLDGAPKSLSWRDLLSGEENMPFATKRIIVLQPQTDFGSLAPGAAAMEEIRRLARSERLNETYEARVRLTGSLALAQEELESVVEGLGLAGILSLVLVVGLLFWALKSIWLLLATVITLVSGLILTAGFATFSVGTLNLISVAFAVLFIGLSVDFGIHFCLRFREHQSQKDSKEEALILAAQSSGRALTLTAICAAIGFYSFLPTDYLGLAELGLIAGSGMFIALFSNLTLLPALIMILPAQASTTKWLANKDTHSQIGTAMRPSVVLFGFAGVLVVGLSFLPKAGFDFDPLNLRDPDRESVSTLLDLMTDPQQSPYTISVLAENIEEARQLNLKLSPLGAVEGVATASSLIPTDQDAKLDLISSLALFLSPSLENETQAQIPVPEESRQSLKNLQQAIKSSLTHSQSGPLSESLARLNSVLPRYLERFGQNPDALIDVEKRLLGSLNGRIVELKQSLNADTVELQDLPPALRNRMISANGQARVDVFPSGDMQSREALEEFVQTVRTVAPNATGAPITIFEAGNTVVRAFIEAAVVTIIFIAGLVLLLTRNIRDILLIFLPLLVAAIMTGGMSGLLGLPFNFANVIVLPLLFGLGIAGNIHLVLREQQTGGAQRLMTSSTPRAVIFSALTTVGSFGSISLSSHPGTSSMGVLLTIAIVNSLVCSLILLPALMKQWPPRTDIDAQYQNVQESG